MTEDEKKAFFMESDTENPGNVGFIAKGDEQEIAEKYLSLQIGLF